MSEQNVFKVRQALKDLLGDKYRDAIAEPKQTLQDIPYDYLSRLLERVPPASYAFLAEEIDPQNQDLYEVFVAAKEILDIISARFSLFSTEELLQKAERYFKDLDLLGSDAAKRDLSDLKLIVRGNTGNYFDVYRPCKHFLVGDLMERYFDHCLEIFKKNRSEEFMELLARKAS